MSRGVTPESEDESLVPVVGEEPVITGAQRPGHGEKQGLVAGSGYLEMDPALALKSDLPVVERPRGAGEPKVLDEFGSVDSPVLKRPSACGLAITWGTELSRPVLLPRQPEREERTEPCAPTCSTCDHPLLSMIPR